jgi:hypothetical protein
MSVEVKGNEKTFTTGEAVVGFRRVKVNSSGNVVYADAGEDWIGVTVEAAASGNNVAVRLKNGPGTFKMMAAGAFSILDTIYGAADGKVDDDPVGALIGRALEAATADGDVLEIFPDTSISQGAGDSVEVIGGAGDIAALNLVYVSDQTDAIMTVLKAQGTSGGRFADYICPNAITAAARGLALKNFLLEGIDTSAGSIGDPVYLSDSAAGAYTLTKPTGTDKVQVVGRIVEDDASTGAILFDLSGPQQVVHDHSDNSKGGAALGAHTSDSITLNDGKDIIANITTGSKIGGAAAQKLGRWGVTPVVQPGHNADPAAMAALTQNALTDNGGGTADQTVADQSEPTTLTDSTGDSATHDDTLADGKVATQSQNALTDSGGGTADQTVADQSEPTTLTDSTGDSATHDDTLADGKVATQTQEAMTDSSGGTANTTIEAVSGGGADAPDNASAGQINNNFADIAAQLAKIKTDVAALITEIVEQNQNDSDLAQKVIELVALGGVAHDNLKEVTTELALIKTDVAAAKTAIDANKAAIDALNADDATTGMTAVS